MSRLDVRDLTIRYRARGGHVHAVNGVSFSLDAGGSLGLVGESGCGKSTLATALLGLLPEAAEVAGGAIALDGADLLAMPAEELRRRRWTEIAYVPQGAAVAMSPVSSLYRQFQQAWDAHRARDAGAARRRSEELLRAVELSPSLLDAFPHQLSGGMRQRAIIAMSLLFEPACLIADEPTTGLDVIVQRQVLDVLKRLQSERKMTLVFVSHDIAVVAELCRSMAVMYAGEIVELGATRQVLKAPLHPYSMALRRSFPDIRDPGQKLISIPGRMPILHEAPSACVFAARCPFARERCRIERPQLRRLGDGQVACHFAEEAAAMAEAFRRDDVWDQVAAA